ncbi:MAG: putative sulfate exporter family transporter [Acidobacteria bacterium]|nr:putative sulfate exporter family transporter [Acidobacteriota bacterium]MBI3425172.1 putative sulfate exporter family transporter [Acidobacteriota bacterium]
MVPKLLFLAALLFSISPWASPPLALALGIGFGLFLAHPFPKEAKTYAKTLLQVSVVGLGFGMNLHEVVRAGRSGFLYTAIGITATMLLGLALGRMMKVAETNALLIAVGTAICGGSAIAAVGPVIKAKDEEMSISLGTVFILNSVALLIFPAIGAAVGLSQTQFGLWAALAIHDTSSVVGAAAKYGAQALAVGTTVKLARALWIVPLTLGIAFTRRQQAKIQWPWFILFFCLAAVLKTYVAFGAPVYDWLVLAAKAGLRATLFLIGSGISIATLRKVGARPLVLGVVLWLIVGVLSLALIRGGVIGW